MIIIIEGPDGSGKTTLAMQLSKQMGYPIIHRSAPKDEKEKADMMESYLKVIKSGKNAIFDRCWYSEMAYGPVMRDASVITSSTMYELERKLAKAGALIIYCTDSKKTLWNRCQRRGEDYVTRYEDFAAICDAFDDIMSWPHIVPVVRYGFEDL